MSQWTPAAVISVITALAGLILGIIGAWKGSVAHTAAKAAQAKADDNAVKIDKITPTTKF
jgi:hypothetical protein